MSQETRNWNFRIVTLWEILTAAERRKNRTAVRRSAGTGREIPGSWPETSFYSCTYLAIPGLKGRYMVGNGSMPAANLAAVPGEESMSNILSSGNENNADKTFSFSADLSWSSYPYKIWTKNGEDQTVYYGDWIDWKKLQ